MEKYFQEFAAAMQAPGAYHPGTVTSYLGDLRTGWETMSQIAGRPVTLEDLSPELILAMVEAELDRGRKRSTIQRRIASWRAFERFLLAQGYLSESFLPSREALAPLWERAQAPHPPTCLTSEQLQRLWEVLLRSDQRRAVRDLALIALFAEWGFPSQTLIGLRLEDIDLERRVLYVPRPIIGVDEFPLEASYEPLRRYLLQGRQEFDPKPGEFALFVSQLGRGLSRQGVWQLVQGWGRVAELPLKLTPRVLRNTAVYRMIRLNVPVERIQAALGHANAISTTILIRRIQRLCGNLPTPHLPMYPTDTKGS